MGGWKILNFKDKIYPVLSARYAHTPNVMLPHHHSRSFTFLKKF